MKIKAIIKKYASLLCALLVAFMGLLMATPVRVKAEEANEGSNVLEDLELADNFDKTAYPTNEKDYSLNVIQIAESKAGELLIYVYQPSGNARGIVASSINLSTSIEGDNPTSYQNYALSLVNSEGVFYKYRVQGLKLKEDVLRFYSITAIYRPFDKTIDNGLYDDNTLEEMAYAVGQLWTATTYEGTSIYAVRNLELIEIERKHVGFIRYYDGGIFFPKNTDSHYVAFSTSYKIDDLLEVEMQYDKQTYSQINTINALTGKTTVSRSSIGGIESKAITLTKYQIYEGGGDGIFGEKYEYNRIQRMDDFCSKEELSAETKSVLSDKQWVLRFAETDFTQRHLQTTQFTQQIALEYTEVTGVVIFRLEYEYDGEIYNLGVVDNISRGDNVTDGEIPDIGGTLLGGSASWNGASLKDIVKDIFNFPKVSQPQPWYERVLRIIVIAIIAVALVGVLVLLVRLVIWICRSGKRREEREYSRAYWRRRRK